MSDRPGDGAERPDPLEHPEFEAPGPVPDFSDYENLAAAPGEMTGPIPTVDAVNEPASEESMMRSSAVMAVGTIISRLTGVLRDTALTAALGLTIVRDAFALGNSLPNILYILIVGGALNAVFVPQLVRKMKEDRDGGKAYADALLTATGTVLLIVTAVSVLAAPIIVSVYATDSYTAEQTDLAVAFARYCLPQIFFYGLYTMLSQVLNARGHFAMPMFAPIANNVVAIGTYLLFLGVAGTAVADDGVLTASQTALLGIGTTLGITVQALILIPVLTRTGYRYGLSWKWRGLGLGKAARLAGWTIGLVAANQLAFVVITRLATEANVNALEAGEPPAGLATYQTGYLIFMLPHSVITVSIVTALLPSLSRTVAAGYLKKAGHEVSRAARMILLLVAPLGVILFLAAGPISSLLFGYGAADAQQIAQLGIVTQVFTLAILPFTVYYVLLRGFYATEDTRTPFYLALVLNTVNVAVALALFPLAGSGAQQVNVLAFAYAVAYWVILVVAWPILSRRFGGLDTRATMVSLVKVGIASLAGWAASWLVALTIGRFSAGDSKIEAILDIGAISVVVLAGYFLVIMALRMPEARDLWGMVAGRLPIGRKRG